MGCGDNGDNLTLHHKGIKVGKQGRHNIKKPKGYGKKIPKPKVSVNGGK